MKTIVAALFLVMISVSANGQVKVVKDARIDALVKNQSAIVPPATAPQISGYRIQLFFDSSKQAVDDARSRFIAMFPKVDTYMNFQAPHYFLKVGDFRNQMEAEKVREQVSQAFPTSFVVKEMVNLPRIDQ